MFPNLKCIPEPFFLKNSDWVYVLDRQPGGWGSTPIKMAEMRFEISPSPVPPVQPNGTLSVEYETARETCMLANRPQIISNIRLMQPN